MEVRLLDSISKKLLPAAPAQDGPQNQIESKPAIIEAEAVQVTWNCARSMNRTKKISEGVRVAQVRQLFVAQHPDPAKRTATSVLIFYGWLEQHRSELLPQGKQDDPFQHVRSDLSGLFEG